MSTGVVNQFVPPFKDRNRERAHAIDQVLSDQTRDEYRVLVFYGSGGHGKTSLSNEIQKELREFTKSKYAKSSTPPLIANLDFDFNSKIGTSNPRQPHEALKSIRVQLGRQISRPFWGMPKANFPSFDIAFREFHGKVSPNLAFEASHPDLAGDNPFLKGLITTLDAYSMGFTGYMWEFLGKRKSQELLNAYHGGKLIDRQWLQSLSIPQLRDMLIDCFAADIRALMWDQKEVDGQTKFDRKHRIVVFVDTYEALWQDAPDKRGIAAKRIDSWMRRLVELTPGVVYIITGRDALQWDSKEIESGLDQRRLEGLPWEDADAALREVGIAEEAIRETILSSAHINTGPEGRRILPFIMQLDADTYGAILKRHRERGGPKPTADMFGGKKEDVLARFLEHLNQDELEALNFLSAPRAFDEELFDHMKSKYFAERPILYSELRERSLYRESRDGQSLTIHALLREHMVARVAETNPKRSREINGMLHQWYAERLSLAETQHRYSDMANLFEEAVHHRDDMRSREYFDWLTTWVSALNSHEEGAVALPVLRAAHDDTAIMFEQSAGDKESLLRHTSIARTLAYTLRNEEQYTEAEEIYRSKIELIEQFIAKNPELQQFGVDVSADYAQIQTRFNDRIKSLVDGDHNAQNISEIYKDVANMIHAIPGSESASSRFRAELAWLQLGLAKTLDSIGGLGNYRRALELFDGALQLASDSMSERNVLSFRVSLAAFLDSRGRHVEAEPQFLLAMNLYMMLGESRDAAVMANNLSKCLWCQGRAEEAVRFAKISHGWFSDHDIRGGLDSAVASQVLGVALAENGQFEEAEQRLVEARRYYDEHMEHQHGYTSSLYRSFARLNLLRDNLDKASRYLTAARARIPDHTNKKVEMQAACDQIEGDILLRSEKFEAAIERLRKALVSIETVNGVDRISAIQILSSLVQACEGKGDHAATERYRSHLNAALLSADMRLQLEGIELSEVSGEDRDRLAQKLRLVTSLPSDGAFYIHRIEVGCFSNAYLYQLTIKTRHGDMVKYAFDFGAPITWTSEVFASLIGLGMIDYHPSAAIELAQIFCSGIRTSDDQFWMILDKDKVPTQPEYDPEGRHAELKRRFESIVPPKVVDVEYVRGLLQSRLDALNNLMSSAYSLAEIQGDTLDLSEQDDEHRASLEEIREVLRVIDRETDRVYIETYIVYSTGLFRALLSLKPGELFDMLLDDEIISDSVIGFRKTIKASADQ